MNLGVDHWSNRARSRAAGTTRPGPAASWSMFRCPPRPRRLSLACRRRPANRTRYRTRRRGSPAARAAPPKFPTPAVAPGLFLGRAFPAGQQHLKLKALPLQLSQFPESALRFFWSASAAAPSGSKVARILSASSSVTSRTRTGISWSRATLALKMAVDQHESRVGFPCQRRPGEPHFGQHDPERVPLALGMLPPVLRVRRQVASLDPHSALMRSRISVMPCPHAGSPALQSMPRASRAGRRRLSGRIARGRCRCRRGWRCPRCTAAPPTRRPGSQPWRGYGNRRRAVRARNSFNVSAHKSPLWDRKKMEATQRQTPHGAAVQPSQHRAQVGLVVTEGRNQHPVASAQSLRSGR